MSNRIILKTILYSSLLTVFLFLLLFLALFLSNKSSTSHYDKSCWDLNDSYSSLLFKEDKNFSHHLFEHEIIEKYNKFKYRV